MNDFDRLWIWDDSITADALAWYRAVAADRMPAKFRIARTISLSLPLADSSEETLWAELDRLTPRFLRRWQEIREGRAALGPPAAGASLLDLCRELTRRMLTHCNFCQWDCGVDRSRADKFGACKLADVTRVSSYFHHPGEELVYRGTRGSGTIFFTSCNMRCAFCQNGDISTDKDNGMAVDAHELAAMARLLRREGCHNINWVGGDPAIHLHTIVEAIQILGGEPRGPRRDALERVLEVKADALGGAACFHEPVDDKAAFNAPMLWNSNFYLSDPAMRILRILMDVWLPDFKFGPGRCAIELSRTPGYWRTVTRHLRYIHDAGEDMTIRHLVMPGHVECCTYPVLDWVADVMPEVPINIMDQYRPDNFCDPANAKYQDRFAPIARRPSGEEIQAAYDHAKRRRLAFEAITYEKGRSGLFA